MTQDPSAIPGTVATVTALEAARELSVPERFRLLMENNEAIMNRILDGLAEKRQGIEDELFDAFYREMAAAIQAPTSGVTLETALNAVRDQARIQAATLTTRMLESELESIGRIVAEGLEQGLGPRQIASRLDVVRGLDSNRIATFERQRAYLETLFPDTEAGRAALAGREDALFNRLLNQRRRTIAQTEARFASSTARETNAKARGAQYKVWITVGDSRVSDMDVANESEGAIPIDGTFSSGHGRPPSHPNCRCTLAYATSEGQRDRMDARGRERAQRTAKAKETADELEVGV